MKVFFLWPVHPQRLPDEILSSWMVRIAQANGFKVHSFYVHYLGRDRQIWNRDIDHLAPDWLLDLLARGTGLGMQRVRSATLRSLEGVVFERLTEVGATRWVLPVGVYHRTRRAFGQQFCPYCIEVDDVPYLRLRWRLALTMVCCRHAVLMQDRCHACGKALAPHRADVPAGRKRALRTTMHLCAYCRQPIAGPGVKTSRDELAMQVDIDRTLDCGYRKLAGVPIYSHLFFDGLRLLMTGAARSRSRNAEDRSQFESCSASVRLRRLLAGYELLARWPDRLLECAAGMRHAYTAFTKDAEPPWWIQAVARSQLFEGRAKLSPEEAAAIFAASGGTSLAQARDLSGRDVRRLLLQQVQATASEDDVDQVIAALDHIIATQQGRRRALFLRDKVMLLVARRWHASVPAISAIDVAPYLVLRASADAFWTNAKGGKGLRAAMAWFAQRIRPDLCADDKGALFPAAGGGRMSMEAIRVRLVLATKAAGCRSGLHSWPAWYGKAADAGRALSWWPDLRV